jgi:outer membrane protein OmpA-like peptidoglycan-associated protein
VGGFAGLGPEINGYTREGYSLGGALLFGIDLTDMFSIGLKTAYFDNLDTIRAFETMLFLRFYFPFLHKPNNMDGPFAQLEAGSVVFLERGYHVNIEAFPSFTGGVSAGWRFNLGERCYVEPAVRAGYPHIWGGSLTAGIRSKNQKTYNYEQVIEVAQKPEPIRTEEEIEEIDGIKVVKDRDGNLRLQVTPVIFRSYSSDFKGLSAGTLRSNNATIRRVAELLKKHKDYKIIIEGYANATRPEGRARERERYTLIHLSGQRALKVLEELGKQGISYERMTVMGSGFSRTEAPYNDNRNNWKNRRVEFILVKE